MFSYRGQENVNREELRKIRDYMRRRGPDGKGEWFSADGKAGMGHRRLSIIDLSERASQPMQSEDGAIVISFNGEIYNYKEIRKRLIQKGVNFFSDSDTEVLIKLYQEKGEDMVLELRGMFAFALWDGRKKAMFIARDPYGIKPLYYSDNGSTIRIASQVKALIAGGAVSKTVSAAGSVGFFLLGSVPEPHTIYKSIRALPAGSYMWINKEKAADPKNYFSIAQIYHDAYMQQKNDGKSKLDFSQTVHNALLDSVRHHFVSDVEVGVFLSSGIDSSLLVALAHEAGIENISTGTLAFEEFKGTVNDEAPLAEEVAKQFGTKHQTRVITRSEFKDELPKIMEAMDQPSIDGINTYFISKVMAERGLKVALSGVGGDELFGGYPSFQQVPRMAKWVPLMSWMPGSRPLNRIAFAIAQKAFPNLSSKFSALIEFGGSYEGAYFLRRGIFLPGELPSVMDQDVASEGLRQLDLFGLIENQMTPDPINPFARISTLESSLYMRNQLLRDADWAGMAHSIEIRTPLVDAKLLKETAAIGGVFKKSKNELSIVNTALKLPRHVFERCKTGFSIPVDHWASDFLGKRETTFTPRIKQWSAHIFNLLKT